MKVQAILERKGSEVVTIEPDLTVPAAAAHMRLKNIGALVVVRNTQPVGVISERDIVSAITRFGTALAHTPVSDVMVQPVTCTPDDDLRHVMTLITRHRMRHLLVMARDRLVGIVSIGDVVKHRLEELELETVVLRDTYMAHR